TTGVSDSRASITSGWIRSPSPSNVTAASCKPGGHKPRSGYADANTTEDRRASRERVVSDEVTVIDNKQARRYEARLGDELAGVLTYRMEDGVAILPHTGVEPRFEGRGIGGRLAKAALDAARESGLKV